MNDTANIGFNSGQRLEDHFADVSKMIEIGKGGMRSVNDIYLSRYACYLIVQNADPSKPVIAVGQAYFDVQTRRQELADQTGISDDNLFGAGSENGKPGRQAQRAKEPGSSRGQMKSSIASEASRRKTAILFARAFGNSPEFWPNIQDAYDLARAKAGQKIERLREYRIKPQLSFG